MGCEASEDRVENSLQYIKNNAACSRRAKADDKKWKMDRNVKD